jgi:hypothetical protein
MPEKLLRQQPVTLAEISQVTYLLYPTGGVDLNCSYRPVDETGTPIGEPRAYSTSKSGAAAQEIRTWITNEVLPELNAAEGT